MIKLLPLLCGIHAAFGAEQKSYEALPFETVPSHYAKVSINDKLEFTPKQQLDFFRVGNLENEFFFDNNMGYIMLDLRGEKYNYSSIKEIPDNDARDGIIYLAIRPEEVLLMDFAGKQYYKFARKSDDAQNKKVEKAIPSYPVTVHVKEVSSSMPIPHAPNAEQWVYSQKHSDEFNETTLDAKKWHPNNPDWLGREPSLFLSKNVRVENGYLILSSHREEPQNPPNDKYHTYTSSAVQSKEKLHYGFYEARVKASDSAISSAFWLYTKDDEKQEEIDIFEICGRQKGSSSENVYFATAHYLDFKKDEHFKKGGTFKPTSYRFAEAYVIAGLEWNEKEVIWYLNGKEVHRIPNTHWDEPETVNFDSETFPSWWGLPQEGDNGGEFYIDYFRYYTKKK